MKCPLDGRRRKAPSCLSEFSLHHGTSKVVITDITFGNPSTTHQYFTDDSWSTCRLYRAFNLHLDRQQHKQRYQ